MPQFTVKLADGGEMHVNASSQEAANGNVGSAAAANQPSPTTTSNQNGGVGSLTAADGQHLGDQTPATRAQYQQQYGGGAEQAWVKDHNASIGAPVYMSNPTVSASGAGGGGADGAVSKDTQANIDLWNQQAEALKVTAATSAADIAYKYWHDQQVSIPGLQLDKDKLAFDKATQAAKDALDKADLQLRTVTESHDYEIRTGTLQLNKLTQQQANALGLGRLALDTLTQQDNNKIALGSQGIEAMKLAASLQGDPFKQQQVINGLSAGGYSNAINAALGRTEQPGFQAPTGSAASSATLPALAARMGVSGAGTVPTQPGTIDPMAVAAANGSGNTLLPDGATGGVPGACNPCSRAGCGSARVRRFSPCARFATDG